MRKILDLSWKRFGRLVVCAFSGRTKSGNSKWLCRCDCGKTVVVISSGLLDGSSKSCGCLRKELAKKNSTKHGKYGTRLYEIWRTMKKRITNNKCRAFKNYGGRGITMCDAWLNSFESFYNWAINSGYSEKLTIDRIDNNKGYYPENCRWATRTEQARNKRGLVYITYNGETKLECDWAKHLGITRASFWGRIQRNGVIKAIEIGKKQTQAKTG